jgi:hypothetical protein
MAATAGEPGPAQQRAAAAPPAATPAEPGRAPLTAADLQRILDALPAMISATDREGRRIYANAASTAAEPAPLPDPGRGHDLAVFAAGRPVPPYREEAPGKAGRRLLTSKVPLRDAAGEVVAVLTASFELPGETAAEETPGEGTAPPAAAAGSAG